MYNIEGFPTLFYFYNVVYHFYLLLQGKYTVYEGGRDIDSLKEFALEGYEDAEYKPCPKLPSLFDKKVEVSPYSSSHCRNYPSSLVSIWLPIP